MEQDVSSFKVSNREDFITFLNLLRINLETNKEEWENITLDRFLEAMEAYTEDLDGVYLNNKIDLNLDEDKVPWRVFADILIGATIYE